LNDPSKSVEERRFALRFLIHLVEDPHMPLHVGDNRDKGGNQTQVRFYDRGTNMHRLWDSDMIEREGDDEDFWLADLAPRTHQGTAKRRAEERLRIGRQRACWQPGKPTKCPRRVRGSSSDRS